MKTSSIFPRCPVSIPEFKDRIFINENLTGHRRFVMGQANKMRRDGLLLSCWSLDGKIFVKTSAFTYESKTLRLKSRIDFFLIAQSLKLNIRTAEIRSSIAPDHKAMYLSVEINDEFHRGPGTWKFNNQLLEDENYVQLITECQLPRILAKYQEVESHQLLWELFKMEFRAETITYTKAKHREFKNREIHLQEKLDAIDNEICHGHNHFNQSLLDEYESIKTELKDIYEKKGKEAMFRSKAQKVRNLPIIFLI